MGSRPIEPHPFSGDPWSHAALRLLEAGYDIHIVQELLGQEDVSTTMIDTHVLNQGCRDVKSPADRL